MAHAASIFVLGQSSQLVVPMALAGAAYVILTASFVYALPWTAGLSRTELLNDLRGAANVGRLRFKSPAA
jgi:hypothetical protein